MQHTRSHTHPTCSALPPPPPSSVTHTLSHSLPPSLSSHTTFPSLPTRRELTLEELEHDPPIKPPRHVPEGSRARIHVTPRSRDSSPDISAEGKSSDLPASVCSSRAVLVDPQQGLPPHTPPCPPQCWWPRCGRGVYVDVRV